jgi:hypothetical protein
MPAGRHRIELAGSKRQKQGWGIGIYEIPDVINIGFSTKWQPRNIRIAILALLLLTSTVSLLSTGSRIGLPLTLAVYAN